MTKSRLKQLQEEVKFPHEPINMERKGIWMHSIERHGSKDNNNPFISFTIFLITLMVMGYIIIHFATNY